MEYQKIISQPNNQPTKFRTKNCEINLILTCSANCVIANASVNHDTTFPITDYKTWCSSWSSTSRNKGL